MITSLLIVSNTEKAEQAPRKISTYGNVIQTSDLCIGYVQDEQQYSKEQWDEKITDCINYFLILRAIVAFGSTGR